MPFICCCCFGSDHSLSVTTLQDLQELFPDLLHCLAVPYAVLLGTKCVAVPFAVERTVL
jgi:hypothetical protein